MRPLRTFATILLPVTLIAGCDGKAGTESFTAASSSAASSSAASPVESSAPAWTGEEIPDGTYSKTVTRADAKAVGMKDKSILDEMGTQGSVTYSFKFVSQRWTVFTGADGMAPEPGDLGTLKYDRQGDVSMLSDSSGCPGCVYTYDWELTDQVLTLNIVGHKSTDGAEDLAKVRFITEGDFTKQS